MEYNKMRFGIMCNSQEITQWQSDAIHLLIDSGLCECVLIIENNQVNKNIHPIKKIFSKNFLYNFLLNRCFNVVAENKKKIGIKAEQISVNTIKKDNYSEYFEQKDIDKVKSYQLDFILRFGFGIIRGEILNAAKYGVWSYHHGDEQKYRGGPFGFWEIYNHEPTTGVIFQKLTNKLDAGYVLLKREYKTIFHSWKESRQKLLQNNIDMPLQAVKILKTDSAYIEKLNPSQTKAKIYHQPNNLQMLYFLLKIYHNRVKFYFQKYFYAEKWQLAKINKSNNLFDELRQKKLVCQYIQPEDKKTFYADGFLLDDDTIVFENYSYKLGKGCISAYKNEQMNTLLEKKTHLAYPYIFNHNHKKYLLPEQSQTARLTLYELNNNNEIVHEYTILELPAVDASIHYDGEYFWLFCALKNDCPNEKLFLYYSHTLTGKYTPHTLNPVKVNAIGARPAGQIFVYDNVLIRPSQSCIPHYGSKIIFQNVSKLTPHAFEEYPVFELHPEIFGKQYSGTHNFSQSNNYFLFDCKTHVFNPFAMFSKKV